MFDKRYIIIIAVIVCLFVLYYFYDGISSLKKLMVPCYQKSMALETRMMALEKKLDTTPKKKSKTESPVYSITYQSDMAKNNNLSSKFEEVSETEAKKIFRNLQKKSEAKEKKSEADIGSRVLSKNDGLASSVQNTPKRIIEESDCFDVNFADILNKGNEYKKILDGLSANDNKIQTDDINTEIVRGLSESVKLPDIESEDILSELPKKKAKKSKTNKKSG